MDLEQLIDKLAQQGVILSVLEQRLLIQSTQGALDTATQALLTDFEEEIVLWLESQATVAPPHALPQVIAAPDQRYAPFPLTDIQHAYWVGRSGSFALGDVGTHVYFEVACQPLDLERLNHAWQQVIARHEMLRAIVTPDGQQRILRERPNWQITVYDLRGQLPVEAEAHIAAVRDELSHQVLPADHWPLFDIRASQLVGETRLHLSFDVLFWDFASLLMILNEWQALYEQPTRPLPVPQLSFRDYVVAAQKIETTDLYQQAESYWRNRLVNLPPAPEFPLAQDPAMITQTRTQRRAARLDRPTWTQLQQRTQQQGLTANGVLLAAFAEVLTVWCKQPAFTLNLTLFNRLPLHPHVNAVIGDFTTINLLTVDNSQPAPFVTRAQRLQKQLWDDLDHRAFSGVRVLRELARQQGATAVGVQMPIIFTSGLGFETGRGFQPFGELVYGSSQTPQAWLDQIVIEENGDLVFHWDAVEALFSPGLLDDLFTAYCDLLHRLAHDATAWHLVRPLPLPAAQAAQRAAVNNTAAPLTADLLHTLFLQQVPNHANQPAVLTAQRTLTYDELYHRANQIGHWLRNQGVRPNTLVAVVMEKGWEQVVAVLGIHFAGAAYLPIDPNLPSERQHYLLRQGEAVLALTQSKLVNQLVWPDGLQTLVVDTLIPNPTLAPLAVAQQPTDLAYVIYTSGSTGQPKGVMIDHRGAVNTVLDINRRFGVTAQDRVLALSALNFDLSVYDIFGLLAVGGAIVLPDPDLRNDADHWLDLMQQHGVTLWDTVPALMQMLVDTVEARQDDKMTRWQDDRMNDSTHLVIPSSLHLVMLSGDWIPVTLPDRIKALWDGVTVYGLGGATEASIWSNYFLIEDVDPSWPSIPYGKPLANQSFQVLDANLNPRPVWVPGDLYIGGIGLALGYWKDEEKTRAKFMIHPQTGERLYKTGDLGRYLPDGNLEFLGREDFQVKIRGHRIELGEIEAVLLQHPAIKEAVVNAVGDPKGNRHLVAYVVADERSANSQDAEGLFVQETAKVGSLHTQWQTLVEAAHHNLDQQPQEPNVAAYLSQWASLDQLYIQGLYHAFMTLDLYQRPGESYTLAELMTRGGIAPRYQKWLHRALLALVEAGWLQQHGACFASIHALPSAANLTPIQTFTAPALGEASVALFTQTAANLADVVTERVHSAELYATESNVTQVYAEGFGRVNQLLCAVVRAFIHDQQQDLNILEVGAGYGSTTAHLLPLLSPTHTHYTFTDVSDFFLQRAQQTFASYPFLSYGLLDLEASPMSQGYKAHSFDLIIAASVLHVPQCIADTLQHLRTLLAPGGLLIMIEETQFHAAYDLGMGLQQGFERFADLHLRPLHPLLSREQWQEQLQMAGFVDVALFNQRGSIAEALGLDILVAQSPATVQRFHADRLHTYLAKKLPDYMVPSHTLLLEALPLTANGKVNRQALPAFQDHAINPREVALPETPTQEGVAKIWTEVLKSDVVGIHEDFFGLGGDSLLATKAVARIRSAFAVDLPLRAFLERPTVAELATYLDVLDATRTVAAKGAPRTKHQHAMTETMEEKEVEEW